MIRLCVSVLCLLSTLILSNVSFAQAIRAGVAKVDITKHEAGPVNDPLFAKALVIADDRKTMVLVSVDAVAIGEIGYIKNDYLPAVRKQLESDLGIPANHLVVNASHCHGIVCDDVAERTLEAIRKAKSSMVPVRIGTGLGTEDRIMENRRLKMKDGREIDVRHAYSLPADDQVAGIGPVDPKIGVVRIDRMDGSPLAVLYQFACHPIQGAASGGNTADLSGVASRVIEENLGHDSVALFFQGCGGDINPVLYKDVHQPRDGSWHGTMLGLSTLQALRKIETRGDVIVDYQHTTIEVPRANLEPRIAEMEIERERLMNNLKGTSLNLKTFLPLAVQYQLDPEHPSYYSHRYLREQEQGREDLKRLDAENRRNMAAYVENIQTMESLTRLQTNLALLRKHHVDNTSAPKRTIDVEVCGVRLGDFRLVTFPGELTVQIGLNIQRASQLEGVFVSGYTNGYIYYCPTADQLRNLGGAQEDSDCILDAAWQEKFETHALGVLRALDGR
ncbi:MAG: hypothetical protein LW850_34110 [Planctomycetaceae bacterium]|jgi:hypothetical protein|nr:hypothetical protein [Planctomycetaceae bacterium]